MSSVKGGGGHSDPDPRGPNKDLIRGKNNYFTKDASLFLPFERLGLAFIVLSAIQHIIIGFDSMILKKLLNF